MNRRRIPRERPRRVSGDVLEPRRIVVAGREVRYVVHERTGQPVKNVTPPRRRRPGRRPTT